MFGFYNFNEKNWDWNFGLGSFLVGVLGFILVFWQGMVWFRMFEIGRFVLWVCGIFGGSYILGIKMFFM